MTSESEFSRVLLRKVLQGDTSLAQVMVSATVLDKYRDSSAYKVLRTNTIGRLLRPQMWYIDFGISPGDETIHLSLGDMLTRIPEAEREHWLEHVDVSRWSQNYARTRLHPASCIEDGELRAW